MCTTAMKSSPLRPTRSIISAAILVVFLLSGCVSSLSQTAEERSIYGQHVSDDTRTWRSPDEAEIGVAQLEARRRWPEFVKAYTEWNPTPPDKKQNDEVLKKEECFEVKIPLTVLFATEHIWMNVTALNAHTVTGKLDAAPNYLLMFSKGTAVTVPIENVEDWIWGNSDFPLGAFTTSVLRKSKLQEMTQIELQAGQPTQSSVSACNAKWERIGKKWQGFHPHSDHDLSENDKKELRQCFGITMLIDDANRAQRNTYPKECSPSDLARACGLPLRTIQLIEAAGKHFPKYDDKAK
jgi:uncharacterized protein YegJ (DUF2314 family)